MSLRPLLLRSALVRQLHAMGSIEWGRCAWCWAWVDWPYIIDGLGIMCETCLESDGRGERPPLQPDGRARKAQWLRQFFGDRRFPPNSQPLPEVVHALIAQFLEHRSTP